MIMRRPVRRFCRIHGGRPVRRSLGADHREAAIADVRDGAGRARRRRSRRGGDRRIDASISALVASCSVRAWKGMGGIRCDHGTALRALGAVGRFEDGKDTAARQREKDESEMGSEPLLERSRRATSSGVRDGREAR